MVCADKKKFLFLSSLNWLKTPRLRLVFPLVFREKTKASSSYESFRFLGDIIRDLWCVLD